MKNETSLTPPSSFECNPIFTYGPRHADTRLRVYANSEGWSGPSLSDNRTNEEQRSGLYFAHAQGDLNLRMFEDIVSFDAALKLFQLNSPKVPTNLISAPYCSLNPGLLRSQGPRSPIQVLTEMYVA